MLKQYLIKTVIIGMVLSDGTGEYLFSTYYNGVFISVHGKYQRQKNKDVVEWDVNHPYNYEIYTQAKKRLFNTPMRYGDT